jgi:hypothetical protein
MFLLSEDLDKLEKKIAKIGNVGLVTIDPITAYMGGKLDSHRATDVRNQLSPIKDLAERIGVGFSAVTHPPKNAGQRALDHFLGSQAFIAVPRVGHLCVEEFEQNERGQRQKTNRFLFTNPKNNGAPKQSTIVYEIAGTYGGINPSTGVEVETSKIVWREIVSVTADEALAASSMKQELYDATIFLMDLLANGPETVAYIEDRAKGRRGLSEMQLKRAKRKMGIVAFKEKKADGAWSPSSF